MKNASQPYIIKFRNKFANKIPEGLEDTFIRAVHHVNSMSEKTAIQFLWSLTYSPEAALNEIGMTCDEVTAKKEDDLPFVTVKLIPNDLVIPLRNELRYQRKCIDEGFGEITVSDEMTDAFNAFYDATSQDDIVSSIVLNACQTLVKYSVECSVNRCIVLLSSNQENNSFGGLRSLDFSREEAEYLKPYSMEISKLLTAMYNEEQEIIRSNSPFSDLAERLEERSLSKSSEVPTEELCEENLPHEESDESAGKVPCSEEIPVIEKQSYEKLTALNIVANAEIIDTFFDAYDKLQTAYTQIREANINPDEVISKRESVSKILEAIKVLS